MMRETWLALGVVAAAVAPSSAAGLAFAERATPPAPIETTAMPVPPPIPTADGPAAAAPRPSLAMPAVVAMAAPQTTASPAPAPQPQAPAASPQLADVAGGREQALAAFDGASARRRLIYGTAVGRAAVAVAASRRLKATIVSRINAEPVLAPHAEFLRSRGVHIRIAGLPETTYAKYQHFEYSDKRVITLNRGMIGSWIGLLTGQGKTLAQAVDAVAHALLPLVGHELRHGITRDQWQEGLGLGLLTDSRESEVISWADQLRIAQSLGARARAVPDINFEMDYLGKRWKQRGWEGIENLLEAAYHATPSFLNDDMTAVKELVRTEEKGQKDKGRLIGWDSFRIEENIRKKGIPDLLKAVSEPSSWRAFREKFKSVYDAQRAAVTPR